MKGKEIKEINFNEVERKWQREWEKAEIFKAKEKGKGKKFYVLEMYPYPSASFLHMGHVRNYTIGDVYARFKRMQGFNVLYPMGYDSFGLPAETAAKKEGIHPKRYTENAIKKIMEYQKALGNSYDWGRVIASHDADYYKWNQYFFLKLYEKGLAYRKKAPVNWCPVCESVLANEEAEGGKCWRCESDVTKKELEQWFFKITAYSEKLLKDLEKIDWPGKIKIMQRNWIGKSFGVEINFTIDGEKWPIFTTRPDTIFGVTFMVISAQHPRLLDITEKNRKKEVEAFVRKCDKARSNEEIESLEKEGVFIGKYAINPLTNEKIPVYAGNFVLADYGCGMVMAVPAHDQRDFEFAKKYKIPIKIVIQPKNYTIKEEKISRAFIDEGILVNSKEFSNMQSIEAIEKISEYVERKKLGKKNINYKIRDWLISRQRYWGTPIPIIYCEKCGIVPVPEKDLPVLLPEKVDFKAKENPLLSCKEFLHVKCPKCKGNAKRETDTMGGFVDSSWYFLRYCDSQNKNAPFEKKKVEYWMPVDQYIGGVEHAVMHLIYARFFVKVLKDLGFVNFDEPFSKLFNQGMVYKDGAKMSKSYGNIVTQDEISTKYGIDTARLFLMFVATPEKQMEWSDEGIEGSFRILRKLMRLKEKIVKEKEEGRSENKVNITIKKVTENIENFEYPKAIIAIIEALDYFSEKISIKNYEIILKLISPFCPHIAEELWHKLGNKSFVSVEKWPEYGKIDEKFEKQDRAIEQLVEDINNILKIIKEKQLKVKTIYIYVLPNEKQIYVDAKKMLVKALNADLEIEIFAVNDKNKYDPQNRAGKAKPGKPAIYVE